MTICWMLRALWSIRRSIFTTSPTVSVFSTYAIRAQRGSRTISVNGAAAHKANPGDILIIAAFATYSELELHKYHPSLVYVDEFNRIIDQRDKIPVQAA